MLKRTCKQCGKEFILSDQEIRFFKSKNLNLPKRCKDCRAANKQAKAQEAPVIVPARSAKTDTGIGKSIKAIVLIAIVAIAIIFLRDIIIDEKVYDNFFESEQAYDVPVITHQFRSDEHLADHFEKHGAEVGASTIDEYLTMANAVINNPNSLTKIETDDGDNDTVYYLESTREFVIVSEDGYIRTYYLADKDYFERQ